MATRAARNQKAYRDREREKKKATENALIGGLIDAVGIGQLRFSIIPVEIPELQHRNPFEVRLYFPNDAVRLAVLKYAESQGLDVDTLISRVIAQGLQNFTGRDDLVMLGKPRTGK